MERLWLRAAIAVLGGLLLAVPLLVAREFGWHLNGGRKLEDPSTRAQVTVVVLDALTDGPLQGIRVWGEDTGASARTNAAGTSTLDLEIGPTLLVAGGRGRAMVGRTLELAAGDNVQVFRTLEVEQLTGRIELPDGGPAAGASVTATPLEWPALPVATPDADANGQFLVPRAVPGSYRVEASLEREGRALALVRAPGDDTLLRLSGDPLPELPGGEAPVGEMLPGAVDGPVVSVLGPDGGTVPGALVVAAPPDRGMAGTALRRGQLTALCATDLQGRCKLPADAGCVLATALPHADSEVRCAGEPLQLQSGLVLSGNTGRLGAPGGWVSASTGHRAAVGGNGGFLLQGVPPGEHTLHLFDAQGRPRGVARVALPVNGDWTWPTDEATPSSPLTDGHPPAPRPCFDHGHPTGAEGERGVAVQHGLVGHGGQRPGPVLHVMQEERLQPDRPDLGGSCRVGG